MSFGPADLYAIAFPGERIPEGVRNALRDATSSGVITLLDIVVVRRTADNVLDVLGRGGMATVVLAVDRLTSPCASRARSFRQASRVASPTKRGEVSVLAP